MSMPVIERPENPVTPAQAVTDLIEGIAREEAALSSVLWAEGQKLQAALTLPGLDAAGMLEISESAAGMVHAAADFGQVLKDKLVFVADNLYENPAQAQAKAPPQPERGDAEACAGETETE